MSWRPSGRLHGESVVVAASVGMFVIAQSSALRVSAVATATALAFLARIDLAERRVPRAYVRVLGATVTATVAADALGARASAGRGLAVSLSTLIGLGAIWWIAPRLLGFADVKVSAMSAGAAAAVSWGFLVNLAVVTAIAGLLYVCALRLAVVRHSASAGGDVTVPLVPLLCAGFVVGSIR